MSQLTRIAKTSPNVQFLGRNISPGDEMQPSEQGPLLSVNSAPNESRANESAGVSLEE